MKKSNVGSVTFLLCLYFVVPILIARLPLGAKWQTILVAYAVWFGLLVIFGLSIRKSGSSGEAIGWPLIAGMFWTIPAISLIVFLQQVFG